VIVNKLSHINDKIIPFFIKYPILPPPEEGGPPLLWGGGGVKALDFSDFIKVADLMRDKGHLTSEGLDNILNIKSGMNKGRNN